MDRRKLFEILFVAAGFLGGSLIGLAGGFVVGGEFSVVLGYGLGAIGGVCVVSRILRRVDLKNSAVSHLENAPIVDEHEQSI